MVATDLDFCEEHNINSGHYLQALIKRVDFMNKRVFRVVQIKQNLI